MIKKETKELLFSLRKTAYITAVAAFFVVGISYMQASFTYPAVNPFGSNVGVPINLSSTFQDKAGGFEAKKVAVTSGFILNGISRTVAQGWPTSDVMAQCHLEVRRVDTALVRFSFQNDWPIEQYPTCDDYLTREARLAGWTHSGGDNCTTVVSSDCQGGVPSACVYTRLVCTNGITVAPSVHATSTYLGTPLTVPGVQCGDGINNDPEISETVSVTGGNPASTGNDAKFSPDGLYLLISHVTTPFITWYSRPSLLSQTFTKLTSPTVPGGTANESVFAPDGLFLAVAHTNTPSISLYNRATIATNTWTKQALPPAAGGAATVGNGVAVTSDGLYFALAHDTSPYLAVYKRATAATVTLTKVAGTPTIVGSAYGVAFSPNGLYLAVTHATSPYISIYKRPTVSSDVFTQIANPDVLPGGVGDKVVFSPDGLYVAVVSNNTPKPTIYKRPSISSDVFTKIADPIGAPTIGNGNGISFSPNGLKLAVTHSSSPYVDVYVRPSTSSDVFTKITDPTEIPEGNSRGVLFSSDSLYYAVAHATTPFVSIFNMPALGDALTDYPADPQCGSVYDTTESSIQACSDGINNSDGDSAVDFPNDLQCENAWDISE